MHYRRWRQRGDTGGPEVEWTHRPPATCKVEGCDGTYHARGYCTPHYTAWRRWGDPLYVHEHEYGCFVCHHDDRDGIELALLAGAPLADIPVAESNPATILTILSAHARDCMGLPARKRLCPVCLDERVEEIDALLLSPFTAVAKIARGFSHNFQVMSRHKERHAGNTEHAAAVAAYHVARLAAIKQVLS